MADIPQNETYSTGITPLPHADFVNKLSGILNKSSSGASPSGDISAYLASRGITPGGIKTSFGPSTNSSAFLKPSNVPIGTPFDPSTYSKYSSLPEGYAADIPPVYPGDKTQPRFPGGKIYSVPNGAGWVKPNLETTQLRSFQNPDMPGQYIIDTSQKGSIIKSNRALTPTEKRLILDGRPSDLWQVDHIIPLWAGGADTRANYQVISNQQHREKSKAESVILTLWANRQLSDDQAKYYVQTLKGRDLTDIPNMKKGQVTIPLEDAQRIKERWDKQMAEVQPPTFKSFLQSIPEGGRKVAEAIGRAVKPLGFVGEFIKGATSGLSSSWVPYTPEADANIFEKGAGYMGYIAGSLLPISLTSKVVLGTSKVIAGAFARKISSKLVNSAAVNYKGIQTVLQITPARAKAANEAIQRIGSAIILPGAGFIAYNQAGPQGVAGMALQQEGTRAADLFVDDLMYGMIAPIAPSLFRGVSGAGVQAHRVGRKLESAAGKTVTGQLSKPFTNVADTFTRYSTDSLMAGGTAALFSIMRDDNPMNALTTGATIGIMHGLGMKYATGAIAKNAEAAKLQMQNEIRTMSHNILSTYAPSMKQVKAGEPPPPAYTQDQVINLRNEAMGNLDDMLKKELITPETYHSERTSIFLNSKILGYETMPETVLRQSLIDDYVSLAEQSKRLMGRNPHIPAEAYTAVETMGKGGLLSRSYLSDTTPPSGQYPTGSFDLAAVPQYRENAKTYMENKAVGRAAPMLIGVERSEMAPIFQAANNRITQLDIAEHRYVPSQNPQNSVEWFALSWDEAGVKTLAPVGWSPRKSKMLDISEGGTLSAQKMNDARRATPKGKEFVKAGNEKADPYWRDPEFNKDVHAEAMKRLGTKTIFGNFDDSRSSMGGDSLLPGESKSPVIRVVLNDASWGRSVADANPVSIQRKATVAKSQSELLHEVNTAMNAKKKTEVIKEFREKVQEPADALLVSPQAKPVVDASPSDMAAVHGLFEHGKEAFSHDTPQAMVESLKKFFGVDLSEESAMRLFEKRFDMSNKDFMSILSSGSGGPTRALLKEVIQPFMSSPLFRNGWVLGKSFPELRLLGGMKTPKTVEMTAPGAAPIEAAVAPVSAKEVIPAVETPAVPEAGLVQPAEAPQMQPPLFKDVTATKPHPLAEKLVSQAVGYPTKQMGKTPLPVQEQKPIVSTKIEQPKEAGLPLDLNKRKKQIASNVANAFSDSKKEFYIRGEDLINSVDVPKTRDEYIKALRQRIESIDPDGKIPTSTGVRPLTTQERYSLAKNVRNRLRIKASELVDEAFHPSNEIAFKAGSFSSGGPLDQAMEAVIRADTLSKFGDRESAFNLIKGFPVEDVRRAAELLGVKNMGGILKNAVKADQPKIGKTAPSDEEYKQLRTVQDKINDTVGKQQVDEIDKGLKSNKEYDRALAIGKKEWIKKIFGDYHDLKTRKILGISWSEFGVSKKAGMFPKPLSQTLYRTSKSTRGGQDISHTKQWIQDIANDTNPEAQKMTEANRRSQLDENSMKSSTVPESLTPMSGDTGMKVGTEDIKSGKMRIQSGTQDEGQVRDMAVADTELYPGLTAAMDKGVEPTIKHGLRDARAWGLLTLKRYNDFLRATSGEHISPGFMKGVGMRIGEGKQKAAFNAENNRRTIGFFTNLEKQIEASFPTKRSGYQNAGRAWTAPDIKQG